MRKFAAVVAAVVVSGTTAFAQGGVIDQRKHDMKTLSRAMKGAAAMLKGSTPFNLSTVQATLKTIGDVTPKFKTLFPPDSGKGGDTEALPAVWTKKADFDGRFDALIADAAAATTAIKDQASFKKEWPRVAGACSGCHKTYKAD